tara:strand:+ start:51413 stop:51934 length:522 start_codon:yes stop_codon:yes gene_type:complete
MKLGFAFFTLLFISLTSCSTEPLSDTILLENSLDFIEASPVIANSNEAEFATSNESELFQIINNHRISIGKNSLEFNSDTYLAAEEHNDYMIAMGEISHDNFSNRAAKLARITKAKIVSENVAKDFSTNESAFKAWLESPIHRKNIEGNFTHSAIKIKQDANGIFYFTQIFYN